MENQIIISSNHREAANFAAYLNSKGYDASVGDVDSGLSESECNRLWDDYVENASDFWNSCNRNQS